MTVVVRQVLGQDLLEMTTSEDEEPVQALPTDGAHEALGEGVGPRWQQHRIPKVIIELSG